MIFSRVMLCVCVCVMSWVACTVATAVAYEGRGIDYKWAGRVTCEGVGRVSGHGSDFRKNRSQHATPEAPSHHGSHDACFPFPTGLPTLHSAQ